MYSPAVDHVYSIRRWQSGNNVGIYSTSRGVRNWHILAQVIIGDFVTASCSVLYVAYIAHVVTGVWCVEVGICDARVCLAHRDHVCV